MTAATFTMAPPLNDYNHCSGTSERLAADAGLGQQSRVVEQIDIITLGKGKGTILSAIYQLELPAAPFFLLFLGNLIHLLWRLYKLRRPQRHCLLGVAEYRDDLDQSFQKRVHFGFSAAQR